MTDGVILETARLVLRRMREGDVDALHRVLADPSEAHLYTPAMTREGVVEWIDLNLQRYRDFAYGMWAMVRKDNRELIGDCGLIPQKLPDPESNEIEVSYHVRPDQRCQGLAAEAAQAVRDYAFERLGCERVISLIKPKNLPSRRVAEKNGMQVARQIERRSGQHDVWIITRVEWLGQRSGANG